LVAAAWVSLLGPVEIWVGTQAAPLGGAKPRAILAHLALAEARVVSADALVDGLWGEEVTDNARNTLQYHVGILRRAIQSVGLDDDVLRTQTPGYVLDLPVDLTSFISLRADAERAVRAGAPERAVSAYREALDLWTGRALANIRDHPFAEARAIALDRQWLACTIASLEVELQVGNSEEVLPRLLTLVVDHPMEERFWEQLMTALYRTGRQAEALATYQRARAALVEHLGIEPSPQLRQLEQAVLQQDDQLHAGVRPRPLVLTSHSLVTRFAGAKSVTAAILTGPLGIRLALGTSPIIIGRSSGCDLVLPDEEISRQHARIELADGVYRITDLGSMNGTLVNGQIVEGESVLLDGDRIGIGNVILRYGASS
jgi:DNA-binding SARP family transcriptional activator